MQHRMTAQRFWAKIAKSDGCWLWTGATDKDGYGKVGWARVSTRAHRIAWELTNGAIPPALFVLHRCDNPPCCNPAHLFLGTNSENMRDAAAKGRIPGQQKTHCPQGHEYTPENTVVEHRTSGGASRSCRECDRAYYKEWYAKNREKKIAAGVERQRKRLANDPDGVRARNAEYMRRSRARKRGEASAHSQSSAP